MTDQISLPPLHDPAPGELARRKQHLLSEIARQSHRRLSLPSSWALGWASPRRTIPAVAAVLVAAAAGAYALSASPGHAPIQQGGTTGGDERIYIGTPVANAAEADALLPFNVVLPSNATATSLTVIQTTQEFYGHFDSSTDGTYVLDEQ